MTEVDKMTRKRESYLAEIASGLMHRGVPENLAHQTVRLIYRRGATDALLKEREPLIEFERGCG